MLITLYRKFSRHLKEDSLFRNSFYLMLSTGILGGFGFVFWIICSRLYDPKTIGLATSFISASSLVLGLGTLGINNAMIRFLTNSNQKNALISTSFIITSLSSLFAGTIFLVWAILTHNPIIENGNILLWSLLFLLYLFISVFSTVLESIFIAYRATIYIVYKNFLFSILKIILPFLLFKMGSFAIIVSLTIAFLVSFLTNFAWLIFKFNYRPGFQLDWNILREIRIFAAGNYIGNIFGILPTNIVPLIILSQLGASEAAFFYMPMMIISFLNIIPSASSQSLFAEVSHDESKFAMHLRSSIKNLFLIMLPVAVVLFASGSFILNFFGPDYAQEGTRPLQIIIIASLIGALNYFGGTLLNIKKNMRAYVGMNVLNSCIIVILTAVFAQYGLTSIAYAWLCGQIVTLSVYIFLNWRLIIEVIKY